MYCLKVKSSIIAPLREIEPTILSFSNWTLSFSAKASFLVSLEKFSFWSNEGASEFSTTFDCSIGSYGSFLILLGSGSGAKNNP